MLTSAYVPRRLPAAFVEFMRTQGRHRVLFGTNWPMLSPSRCLEGLDELALDDETRALFLGGNAGRIFGLGSGVPRTAVANGTSMSRRAARNDEQSTDN